MTTILAWLGVAAGGLVGAVAAMTLLGCLMPRSHVAARSALVAADPAEVWRAATDFPGQATWRRGLAAVERRPDRDGAEVWRERHGRNVVDFRTEAAEPPRRLVRAIAEEDGRFRGSWEIRIEPVIGPTTSRVTIVERGSVPNPFFRFVNRFAIGQATRIEGYLRDLAAKYGSDVRYFPSAAPEAGPPPTIGAGPG